MSEIQHDRRPWPYDGPIGRAKLTGNLGVAEPLRLGSCVCGMNCAACEECGQAPELHDPAEGTCEILTPAEAFRAGLAAGREGYGR